MHVQSANELYTLHANFTLQCFEHGDVLKYVQQNNLRSMYYILGIRMRMRCLTRSTWKVRNGEA